MLEPVLKKAVRSVNSDHEARAAIQLVLGALFTFLLFGALLGVLWMFGPWRHVGWPALPSSLALVGLLLAVAFWSAFRRIEPMRGVDPLTPTQELAIKASWVVPGAVVTSPRHATAGTASLLIAGPLNMVDAIASWRSRIKVDQALYYAAADLLGRAAEGVDLEFVDDPRPFVLLRRLRLIKVEERPEGLGRIVLTQKGRDALSEAGMVSL
jgi:hypothetical protein